MTPAQSAQQSHRDPGGRYATRERDEAGTDLGPDEDQVRFDEARDLYGDCVRAHHIDLPPEALRLVEALRGEGMNALLVGGSVRDSFDGTVPKDLDFEIYAGTMTDVEKVASRFGLVDAVGVIYGVLKTRLASGEDVDLSVPRRDNRIGAGHRGFAVEMDPDMTVSEAAERRDFTINTMSYDPRLGVLIDPHGGERDLADGILRHVSDAFGEDPLRVLRGAQFSARFGLWMHPDTAAQARSLRHRYAELYDEGVREEWAKWAEKGRKPSDGLRVLAQTGWDAEHPGLGSVNDADLHAEVDAAKDALADPSYVGRYEARVVLAAVLMRRMAIPEREAFVNRTVTGLRAQNLALRMARDDRPLPQSAQEARQQAQEGATVRERALLASARGEDVTRALRLAETAGVADGPEKDLLDGADMLSEGGKPGPWVGDLISRARAAQAAGVFRDRDGALTWLASARA